jgi:hypothetical protein
MKRLASLLLIIIVRLVFGKRIGSMLNQKELSI